MWNYKKIKKSLVSKGYFEFKNYLTANDLKKVEKTLLTTLNYIKKSSDI